MEAEEESKVSKGEKPQAWYEILISDHFIDYVKSDPDYVKDVKDEHSAIRQLWDVLDGLLYGSIVCEHPTKVKNTAEILQQNYSDWVLKGYWAYINDEDHERDFGTIAKSIREKDETKTFYEHDPNSLSEVQLAFLILYSTWDRPFNPNKYTFREFTLSGYLKEYLLAIKKRHEETVENAK